MDFDDLQQSGTADCVGKVVQRMICAIMALSMMYLGK